MSGDRGGQGPDDQRDDGVEERAAGERPRQDLYGKDDALDQVRVLEHQACCADQALGEEAVEDQADEHDQRVFHASLWLVGAPAGLKHDAEEKGVERERQNRRDERPQHAEQRPAVAKDDVTPRDLPDQIRRASTS
jgi:hypothetical protein